MVTVKNLRVESSPSSETSAENVKNDTKIFFLYNFKASLIAILPGKYSSKLNSFVEGDCIHSESGQQTIFDT